MPDKPLPPHRTRRISLTKAQLRTDLGAELLNLCESITADGIVTTQETEALNQWLADSAEANLPAASYLKEVIDKVLEDGKITAEECREVYRAVEKVLPPEVRRDAIVARREVEAAERERNRPIARANFMVAGARYEGRPEIIERYAAPGDLVQLVRDRDNRFSRNAIAIVLANGKRIGYVPESDAVDLAPLLDKKCKHLSSITKIIGYRSPIPVVDTEIFRSDATVDMPLELESAARRFASHAQVNNSGHSQSARRSDSKVPTIVWLLILIFVILGFVVLTNLM